MSRTRPSPEYTGQVDDSTTENESGLMYYNARYYDPAIGRFISADSEVPIPSNSQAYNRYMYVIGNPINQIDPSGHSFLVALAIATVVGGTCGYVSHGISTGDWTSKEALKATAISATAAGIGFATGVGVSALIGGTGGIIAGGAIGGAVGGAIGGGLTTNNMEGVKVGGISGFFGGMVGGAAFASGIPILSGFVSLQSNGNFCWLN